MKKEVDSSKKALEYAFLLLKYRMRSENEIRLRMKQKKFPQDLIDKTLTFLKDKRFIDDNVFSKAWIDSRIKRPFGLRRIEQELKLKGVDKEVIRAQVTRVKKDYSEEDVVKDIVRSRLKRLKANDAQEIKRKMYAYLIRRGFSPEVVYDAVVQL
ncbi:MAG: regulatory protein RecX [Candidatus Omnitrophica bacterium]|nr:regulatory protein RecX [Candidatus Omnitrophota bacterium]